MTLPVPISYPPDCRVYVDGVRYADGSTGEGPTDPVILTDLRVIWGRENTLDQPEPTTCTFTVMDVEGGRRFLDQLHIGAEIDVRALAQIFPDPDQPTMVDGGFETLVDGAVPPSARTNGTAVVTTAKAATGVNSVRIDPIDGSRLVRIIFPPSPFGDISAWDAVPRTQLGQTWGFSAKVWRTDLLADVQGVSVRPVYFTSPTGEPGTIGLLSPILAAAGAGNAWQTVSGQVIPPENVWLGVAIEVYPTGPRWDDLAGGSFSTRKNIANDPRATTGRWRSIGAGVGGVLTPSFVTVTPADAPPGGPTSFFRKTWTTGTTGSTPSAATGDAIYADGGSALFPVTAGKTYTISCWMRHSSTKPKQYQILAYLYDAAGALLRYPLTQAPTFPINTWVRNSVTFTVQPGEVGMRVTLSMVSGVDVQEWAAGEMLDATGLLIEEAGSMGAYFDGNSPGASWDGTPGLSTSTLIEATALSWDELGGLGVLTNLPTNPTPASATGWLPNNGTQHVHTYNSVEKCINIDRQATAGANIAASWYNAGNLLPYNPVLPAGVEYERSIEIWVDAAATLNNTGLGGGGFTTTALPANVWTRVVQRFTGTGAAYGALAGRVDMPGVGTGVHVKIRRASLVAVSDAQTLPYFDGSTPDAGGIDYAWTGTANASTSTATDTRTAVRWDDLGRAYVDDLAILAPAVGGIRAGSVFRGRITDLEARYELSAGATLVDVTASSHLAELANRYVGSVPWLMEPLVDRFKAIVDASGQAVDWMVDETVQDIAVSWRDVDSQPAAHLLQELAQSVAGALWPASSTITGPYLRLEDIASRAAMFGLELGDDGIIRIVVAPETTDKILYLSACDALLEPIRLVQTVEDDATRVALTWREQTLDQDGNQKPTDREYLAVNEPHEEATGQRRIGVSTQLTNPTDAKLVADSMLARAAVAGWRISGLTMRMDTMSELDADTLTLVMSILDGTTRPGLAIILTDMPSWAPAGPGDVPLYLEGGIFTNTDAVWELELIVSDARAQGKALLHWDDVPDGWSWDQFDPAITWDDLAGVGLAPISGTPKRG